MSAAARLDKSTSTTYTRYGPCRRNHALGSGGNLLDGCQEFDPHPGCCKTCSACGCHRSFHVTVAATESLPLASPSIELVHHSSSREQHKGRKPCRSKQLRAKACQIWTDYLRSWASAHGIHVRFCDNKEFCLGEMERGGHSRCRSLCNQLKWPAQVPFSHPKDMASRELQVFISTYEQDWQEYYLRNHNPSLLSKDLDPCKVSTKELRYWLKENGKPVFCVHPKAANQFVNMGKLATMILRSGGKCKFEAANGWDSFVSSHEGMNKPALPPVERTKCIRTMKRLYNKFMLDFIQGTLREMGLENDGSMAVASVSDDDCGHEDEDETRGADVASKQHQQEHEQQALFLGDNVAPSQQCLGALGLM